MNRDTDKKLNWLRWKRKIQYSHTSENQINQEKLPIDGFETAHHKRYSAFQRVINWLFTDPSKKNSNLSNEGRKKRNYQFYKNNYIFLLGGRIKYVKGFPWNFFIGILMILPIGLFLGFEAKYVWHHMSPAIVITFSYVWLICFTSFIGASVSDPGVLPRNLHLSDNPFSLPNEYFNTISLPCDNEFEREKSKSSQISIDMKYCTTCHIWRLPRSSHCSICNSCILVHDHHCTWLNNCIGLRNYNSFLKFLAFTSLSCFYLIIISFTVIYNRARDKNVSWTSAIREKPIDIFLIVYSFLCVLYPFLLLIFHFFLNLNSYTTREYLNSIKGNDSYINPFRLESRGRNLVMNWFRPTGFQLIGVREPYEVGDRRFDYVPKGRNFNIEK